MKGRILSDKQIAAFAVYLKSEEKSENTVEKYIRDEGHLPLMWAMRR